MANSKKKTSPYGLTKFKTINEYHKTFPKEIQNVLQNIREIIHQAAPEAEEVISYNMPAFKQDKVLVFYAAAKEHLGFYPTPGPIVEFKEELSKYKTSKGAIQFPLDKKLPVALIKKIVKYRVAEVAEKSKTQTKKVSAKNYSHYHKDGSLWAKGKMIGDKQHGYWEFFRKDGVIMRSGNFDKGKQVGEWTTYDKNGKVYKITKMKK